MAQPYVPPCQRGMADVEPCPREAGREAPPAIRRWVLAACVLASSMAFIDGSALTVALPALAADLGAEIGAVQWVISAYVLSLAALTLVGGALADRYGRARVLMIGCLVFALASIACALSPGLGWLVAARLAQGVGAALIAPASLALIGETYPKAERNGAIGLWAAASALTTAGGPLLGGWLTDGFGWEAIFWMNPPLALLAMLILARKAPAGLRKHTRFDSLGAMLMALALAAIAFALSTLAPAEASGELSEAPASGGGPAGSLTMAIAGLVLIGLFIVQQRRNPHPMLPGHVFESRAFTALNIATLLVYAGLSVMFFLLPFELIDARGLSASVAGAALLPFTLAVGGLSQPAGRLADALGARPLLIAGPVLAAVGFALLALLEGASFPLGVLIPVAVAGLGFALLVAPLTAAVMNSVSEEDTGLASGINNTASRVAQLLGVALAAGVAPLVGGFALGLALASALSLAGAVSLALPVRRARAAAVQR